MICLELVLHFPQGKDKRESDCGGFRKREIMEMDEDMEIEPMVFDVREIDLEYEFDAARWYDFTREEFPAESQAAEFWFHSAPSYAPSREFNHTLKFSLLPTFR